MTVSAPADPLVPQLQAIESLILRRELQQAAEKLNAVARSASGDARVYLMANRLAEVAGNPAGSIDACRHAVALAPGWSVAVTELSMALARANQFAESLQMAEKAVQLDGQNPALLSRVIDVAHRAQHLDLALAWLRKLQPLAPGNRQVQHMIARDLRLKEQNAEAIEAYGQLLASDPGDQAARLGRLQAAIAAGDLAVARTDADALLALDPANEEVRFWAEIAHGRTPDRQPESVIRGLYDNVAEIWDQHIVGGLKYKLPRLVADRMKVWHPDLKMNVLDLGCGTGLLGVCLGRIQGALVGVDLSLPMIRQAERHGVYDKFHHTDVLGALQATPESLYEVIAALDVLVYTGGLDVAIPNAHRILKPGGHFVFSCELADADEPDQVLRKSIRYAHRDTAVEAMCRAAGFAEVEIEKMPIRYEGAEQIQGFLVVARKAG